MKLTINLDDLTLGDLADLEDVSGVSLTGINLKNPPLKVIPALVWIQQRRTEPGFTYEMARAIKLTDLEMSGEAPTLAVAGEDNAAAAPASGPNSSKPSRRSASTSPYPLRSTGD